MRTRLTVLFCTFCMIAVMVSCHVIPRELIVDINPGGRGVRWHTTASYTYRVECGNAVGSAVPVDENSFLTAWHVVDNPRSWMISLPDGTETIGTDYGTITKDGKVWTILSRERISGVDAAILHVAGPPVDAPSLRFTSPVIGEWVSMGGHVKGNPNITVTEGAMTGQWWMRDWTVDGAIIPGMSGGPVIDVRGRLLGISVATTTPPGRALGIILPLSNIDMEELFELARENG